MRSQNIPFIDSYELKYVIILSVTISTNGLSQNGRISHSNGRRATIAVIEVPWEEASRFGIMNTDETGRIIEFEEKPDVPKSNLASMGIIVFLGMF